MSNQRDGGKKEHPSQRSGHGDGEHQRQYGNHNWTSRRSGVGMSKATAPVEAPIYKPPKDDK